MHMPANAGTPGSALSTRAASASAPRATSGTESRGMAPRVPLFALLWEESAARAQCGAAGSCESLCLTLQQGIVCGIFVEHFVENGEEPRVSGE